MSAKSKTEQMQTRPAARLALPWPPSTNTYYRNFRGRMVLSPKGREFKKAVLHAVKASGGHSFGAARLGLRIVLDPPTRRKSDIDNRVKAVQDALTAAGVWDDDEQIDVLIVERGSLSSGGGGCAVEIWPLNG